MSFEDWGLQEYNRRIAERKKELQQLEKDKKILLGNERKKLNKMRKQVVNLGEKIIEYKEGNLLNQVLDKQSLNFCL